MGISQGSQRFAVAFGVAARVSASLVIIACASKATRLMPRGTRMRCIVGCVAIALSAGLAQSADRAQDSDRRSAGTDHRGTSKQPLVVQGIPSKKTEAEVREEREHRAKQAATADNVSDALKGIEHESENTTKLTLALFLATVVLAVANWVLVIGAGRTASRQSRAYVSLDDIYFPWRPNPVDPNDRTNLIAWQPVKVRIKNFGNTPAKHLTLRLGGTFATPAGDFERRYGGRNYIGPKFLLSPTQSYATRVPTERFDFHHERPTDGDKDAFIYGAAIYEDIFRCWWLSEFCYHYASDSPNRFIPHWHGNQERQYKSEEEARNALTYTGGDEPYQGVSGRNRQ